MSSKSESDAWSTSAATSSSSSAAAMTHECTFGASVSVRRLVLHLIVTCPSNEHRRGRMTCASKFEVDRAKIEGQVMVTGHLHDKDEGKDKDKKDNEKDAIDSDDECAPTAFGQFVSTPNGIHSANVATSERCVWVGPLKVKVLSTLQCSQTRDVCVLCL